MPLKSARREISRVEQSPEQLSETKKPNGHLCLCTRPATLLGFSVETQLLFQLGGHRVKKNEDFFPSIRRLKAGFSHLFNGQPAKNSWHLLRSNRGIRMLSRAGVLPQLTCSSAVA